jgi:hypothetical protein
MMDHEERELFTRSLRHAGESHTGRALDLALDELGWHKALTVDPHTAVSVLFELQGVVNTSSSALGAVLGSALGVESSPAVGIVFPAAGQWRAPGEIDPAGLSVRGLGPVALVESPTAVIVTGSARGLRSVEVSTADLTLRPVRGLDPDGGLVEATGHGVLFSAEREVATERWAEAIALGRLALGHELVGAARAMLELARGHAVERIQFGQPIGTFQAVRHRLADTLVAIEAADASLNAAWEERTSQSAAMAKALAGRGARVAARHGQQVLAGIGFTTEHRLHRYVRRVVVLDQLLGADRTLTRELGADLIATRQLPDLLPL